MSQTVSISDYDGSDKLAEIETYLARLTEPSNLEFESDEVRRVVSVVAGKIRSIITGEPEVNADAPAEQTKALIAALQRQVFRP